MGSFREPVSLALRNWTAGSWPSRKTSGTIEREMEGFRLYNVVPWVVRFIDSLTNWHIRRSRRRFWKSTDDGDKVAAYAAPSRAQGLRGGARPYMPFWRKKSGESWWRRLTLRASIRAPRRHAASGRIPRDAQGIRRTHGARHRGARALVAIVQRPQGAPEPGHPLTVVPRSDEAAADVLAMKDVILEELNVKELVVERDESHLVSLSARPNFKTLGKKLGPALKAVGEALKTLSQEQLREASEGKTISVCGHGIVGEDLLIDRATKGIWWCWPPPRPPWRWIPRSRPNYVASAWPASCGRIQARRKEMDLAVADRIRVVVKSASDEIVQVIAEFGALLAEEVQADSLSHAKTQGEEAKIEGVDVAIEVEKA
ncbi:MAG: hypothetical protein IPN71_12295 [Fibrobacteres bacterium]|nr:hypothetical protein [Fibrobacterota bacterium]